MKVFHRAADLQEYLRKRRTNNRSVGFVPTMGALH
ncbi:MAG: pantoate--beta-alanine ligase, partial [Bacteroidota bacterium]